MAAVKVGISACLLGDKVRYDGGHKRSSFCQDELAQHVEFVKLCPEVGIGLPVPRPTIRLEQTDSGVQAVIPKTGENVTEPLREFADKAKPKLNQISGYVLCAKSPSCGMERVKLYDPETGHARKEAAGIFTTRLHELFPALPLEEDGRLNDPLLRENFVMRVYVYAAWQALPQPITKAALIEFHSRLKLLLLAHSQPVYRQLGPWLANLKQPEIEDCHYYLQQIMDALGKPASKGDHTNVLQHIQGYFKNQLSDRQKQELSALILGYREGVEPLLAPLTMIKHYLGEHPQPYLDSQFYLNPYPNNLKLRYGL
ncbi:MAG: DUF523 and DUF1722 domain-containing protein [Idiomarina sp.]